MYIYIYIYIYLFIYLFIYLLFHSFNVVLFRFRESTKTNGRKSVSAASLQTKILDFRGFDSSRIWLFTRVSVRSVRVCLCGRRTCEGVCGRTDVYFADARTYYAFLLASEASDNFVVCSLWLRTKWVNTNGAAAKVMIFDRLREKVRPGTFGNIKVGQQEYPKSSSVKKHEICSDPISADPIRPFPNTVFCSLSICLHFSIVRVILAQGPC